MKTPAHILAARDLRQRMTEAETVLWGKLRNRRWGGFKFIRQHPIHVSVQEGCRKFYIADFYCRSLKMVIELDGPSHDEREEYDKGRDLDLAALGYRTLRIRNEMILNDIDSVLKLIN
jgi:very-short-patch-repair endonuclease